MNDLTVTEQDRTEAMERAILGFMAERPDYILDEQSAVDLLDYIEAHGLNRYDSNSYRAAYDARERVKRDRENRIVQWQQGRAAYLRSSDEDKTQAIDEFRNRQQKPAPPPFVPDRQYTDAEINAMTADEYRKVLGVTRLEDIQGNTGYVLRPALAPEGVRTGFRKPRLSLQARKLLGLDK